MGGMGGMGRFMENIYKINSRKRTKLKMMKETTTGEEDDDEKSEKK